MMNKAVLVAAFVACQCTLSFAQAQTAAIHQGHKDQLDTNKDGTVQRGEYQTFMAAAFTGLDKNKDGRLSKPEVGTILTVEQFSATDGDANGSISQAEFMNRVMADFAAADRSGDGALQ